MEPAVIAVACGNILGETAAWSVREQALYWVDIRAPALHRLEPAGGDHRSWPMPELCSAVILARSGIVLAFKTALMHFNVTEGRLTPLLDVEPKALNNRLNEAKCDRAGRLWIGSMRDFGAAVTGSLYRIGGDLRQSRVLTGITIPNSLGWSPDGGTMYFADTATGVLGAYAFDQAEGTLGTMRIFVAADVLPGRPDGCTVDAEGHVWNARYGAGCVARLAPDGTVRQIVSLPTSQPTSCALGGADLCTLFVTTARQRLSPEQLAEQLDAGHLFAARVNVPGLPEPLFAYGAEGGP